MSRLHYENDGQEWVWWRDDSPYCYYTNKRGMGLFMQDLRTGETHQVLGTCSFSLNGLKDPKAKIRRMMK